MGLASSKWKWAFALSTAFGAVTVNACVGDDPSTSSPGNVTTDSGTSNTCKVGTNSCSSGTCVDGFCCDRACDGQCEACDVAGHEGTCTTVSGAPHHTACTGDTGGSCAGSCDGKTAASCTYPTGACGVGGSCAGGVAQVQATCGNGTCAKAITQTCSLGCFEDGCLGVTQIAAGYTNACTLLTDGKVRCWGDNANGALGLGGPSIATTNYSTPQPVTLLDSAHVKMLGGSNGGFCAVLGDGTVDCWGANGSGELGLGTATDVDPHPTPAAVAGVTGATFISSSTSSRYCAIIAGGQVKCWGDNSLGALGTGSAAANSSTPTLLCAPGSTSFPCTPASGATFIASGDGHMCGAFAGGAVACWGDNGDGELGFAKDTNPHPFPITIAGLTATYLTAGNQTSCAATTSGAAMCWGSNNGGQVGAATLTDPIATPTSVCTKQDCSTHLTGVTGVGTYDDSVCALSNGAVLCWGNNNEGQLGDGNAEATQNYAASTAIASGATYVRAAGQTNFAVVKTAGESNIKCWGDNNRHECGNGDDAGTSEKTPVSPTW